MIKPEILTVFVWPSSEIMHKYRNPLRAGSIIKYSEVVGNRDLVVSCHYDGIDPCY